MDNKESEPSFGRHLTHSLSPFFINNPLLDEMDEDDIEEKPVSSVM
jgi:hypothetical protein